MASGLQYTQWEVNLEKSSQAGSETDNIPGNSQFQKGNWFRPYENESGNRP